MYFKTRKIFCFKTGATLSIPAMQHEDTWVYCFAQNTMDPTNGPPVTKPPIHVARHLVIKQGMYCIVLYCIVLYCIVLYCIVLCCVVLCWVVLCCVVLCCVVLCCVVLFCIVKEVTFSIVCFGTLLSV